MTLPADLAAPLAVAIAAGAELPDAELAAELLAVLDRELDRRGYVLATAAAIAKLEAATPSPAVVGGAVTFHELEAFAEELRRDRDLVERGLVRHSYRLRPIIAGAPQPAMLDVVATAIVAGRIVRLELPIGDLWGFRNRDDDVRRRAREAVDNLAGALADARLELREGTIAA
jgi:hypothetical protein